MEAAFLLVVWTHGCAKLPRRNTEDPIRHSSIAVRHSIMMITLALQNRVSAIQLLN